MPIRICPRPKRPRLRARPVCSRAPIRCCRYPCCSAWLLLRTWHRCVPGGSTGPLVRAALFFSSVVVSKFATFRYRFPSELRSQNDTRNQYAASVLSIPKFAERRYRGVANFGIGTLVAGFAFIHHRIQALDQLRNTAVVLLEKSGELVALGC